MKNGIAIMLLLCYIRITCCRSIFNPTVPKDTFPQSSVAFSNNISMLLFSSAVPRAIYDNDGHLRHLLVEIDGSEINLNLVPVDKDLFDDSVVSAIRLSDEKILQINRSTNRQICHYRSTNHDVQATVSNCDGYFRGMIILENGMYSLEPFSTGEIQSSFDDQKDTKSHAIYKRNAPETFCGLATERHFVENNNRRLHDDPLSDNIDLSSARLSKQAPLTLEIGLFVDSELYQRYVNNYTYASAESRLQDFITTVMNNIQLLYHHASMTPKIDLKVVYYEVFKYQPYEMTLSKINNGDAQTYLDAFCLYQYKMTRRTWDHSILITGIDLIRNGNDHTISGISRLFGVCDSYNSCTLSEGFSFASSFIGAHEIGHSLGMNHDEPNCPSQFVMSNSLGPGKVSWSSCSIADLRKYVDKLDYLGENCMRQPSSDTVSIDLDGTLLPGQKYDADTQCSLFYGPGFRQVTPVNDNSDSLCYMMWCGLSKWGRILTSHPALEGTICDNGKYCIDGRCSLYANSPGGPKIVDGAWSSWSSISCGLCPCPAIKNGIGVLKSIRTCTNPWPQNGGRECVGDRVRGSVCVASECQNPGHSVESYIRAVCTTRKRQKYDISLTGEGSQLTKLDSRACKVFCDLQPEFSGQRNFRHFGDYFPDGTSCGDGKYCVDGECLRLDCSGLAVVADASSCPGGWNVCPISKQHMDATPNEDSWSEWSAWSSCSTTCGVGVQSRQRACSGSRCPGLKEERFSCNLAYCPATTQAPAGQWSTWSDWTECSATCGKGSKAKYRNCITWPCSGSNSEVLTCETASCDSYDRWTGWSIWSVCSKSCDGGVTVRTRACIANRCQGSSTEEIVCNQQSCNNNINTVDDFDEGQWSTWSAYGSCSVTCGDGVRTRSRWCKRGRCEGTDIDRDGCNAAEACAEWGGWSSWSDCGGARTARKRIRNCYGAGSCDGHSFEEKGCWA